MTGEEQRGERERREGSAPRDPLAARLGITGLLSILRALPAGFVLVDAEGKVLLYNRAEAHLAGGRAGSPEGRNFFTEVAPCANVRELAGVFRAGMLPGATLDEELEFSFPFPEGELEVYIRLRRVDHDGRAYGLVLIDDNTRVKRTERALEAALQKVQEQARRDPLTGLYNRRHLTEVLPVEIRRAIRYREDLSVLMVDLDRFKAINDRLGHLVGDEVLTAVAETLTTTLRSHDVCVRWGGEEFCAVLPDAGGDEARHAAERLREALAALRFPAYPDLRLAVSVGVTTRRGAGGEPLDRDQAVAEAERLITRADEALYAAKRAGRDRTVVRD